MSKSNLVYAIAQVCHEANRAFSLTNDDNSLLPWELSPFSIKASSIHGVHFRLENPHASPEDQHNEWMKNKLEDGWVYGPNKDSKLKTHPCLISYDNLPEFQRKKDKLFISIVDALK